MAFKSSADWQLFKRLGVDETSINKGDDLISQLVRNMTSRVRSRLY